MSKTKPLGGHLMCWELLLDFKNPNELKIIGFLTYTQKVSAGVVSINFTEVETEHYRYTLEPRTFIV